MAHFAKLISAALLASSNESLNAISQAAATMAAAPRTVSESNARDGSRIEAAASILPRRRPSAVSEASAISMPVTALHYR